MPKRAAVSVECPECAYPFILRAPINLSTITCEECGAELEVVGVSPESIHLSPVVAVHGAEWRV